MKKKVVIGMSGGVDSSVAAYLLKEAGYHVIGLFMKNWDEEDEHCPQAKDYQDVIAVCDRLDIPFYTINFVDEYYDHVFSDFVEGLKRGITPNPDIWCNKEIKFKAFLQKAMEIGADYLATGHWAKIDDQFHLCKPKDRNKDQTYFLYTLKEEQLKKVLFPLSEYTKPQIRALAKEVGLVTHDKRDSTGICFIGKRKFKEFMEKFIAKEPGNFIDEHGKVLGQHDGISYYTLGQRKGLGIGGPGEAWYVADKNLEENTITLVQGEDHPLLFTQTFTVDQVSWVNEIPSSKRLLAKVRYRSDEHPCTINQNDEETLTITFDEPQRAVTPGQAIVFYDHDRCLGGATIMQPSILLSTL